MIRDQSVGMEKGSEQVRNYIYEFSFSLSDECDEENQETFHFNHRIG